jgi:hypothetical protein
MVAPAALLAPGEPRSEHDPERAMAADDVTMHRLTGSFTDPYHEQAFAAQFFRQAFSIHAMIFAVCLLGISVADAFLAWSSPSSPTVSQWAAWLTTSLLLVLGLVRRS